MDKQSRRALLRRRMQTLLSQKNRNWTETALREIADDIIAGPGSSGETRLPIEPVQAPPISPAEPPLPWPLRLLRFTRSALVLTLVVGAFRLMQGIYPYASTVILAYLFFALLAIEVLFDPWLNSVRYSRSTRYSLLVGDLVAAIWFSIVVPLSKAPLEINAYVPIGDYAPGSTVEGIQWHQHLTELRVAVTNPTGDDYQEFDVLISPDNWTHKAVIAGNSLGCLLFSVGGDTLFSAVASKPGNITMRMTLNGTIFDAHDSSGNAYSTLATDGGYRLRCAKFPSHATVSIMFALVTRPPRDVVRRPKAAPNGGMSTAATAVVGSANPLDVFGEKPSPREIHMSGKYTGGIKPHSFSTGVMIGRQTTTIGRRD